MRACFEKSHVNPRAVPGNAQLRAVAIAPRFGGDAIDLAGPFDLADAGQRLAQDRFFVVELPLVGNVLIVAAAADAENGALRLNPFRRLLTEGVRASANQAAFLADNVGGEFLARQSKRYEDGATVGAG